LLRDEIGYTAAGAAAVVVLTFAFLDGKSCGGGWSRGTR
jgi:hypothetical protein